MTRATTSGVAKFAGLSAGFMPEVNASGGEVFVGYGGFCAQLGNHAEKILAVYLRRFQ
jgi:hypothetical protein